MQTMTFDFATMRKEYIELARSNAAMETRMEFLTRGLK